MKILPVVSLLLEPVKSLGPVLAIKIDNIAQARPQTGLTDAGIVYVLRASRPAAGRGPRRQHRPSG